MGGPLPPSNYFEKNKTSLNQLALEKNHMMQPSNCFFFAVQRKRQTCLFFTCCGRSLHACVWNFKRAPLWIQFIIFSVLEKKTCSAWTSTLSSAHVMTGVHPRTKHLQTCGTLNQARNLQIHSWLALSLVFFFHTTTKKILSEEPGSSYTAIHILAPQLIEIRAKQ